MSVEKILKSIPANAEWLVLFRLKKLREMADDNTVRAMFFLQENLNLEDYSFVILSSEGTLMLNSELEKLFFASNRQEYHSKYDESIYDKYKDEIVNSSFQNPDCIGLGSRPPAEPVIVLMEIENGIATAETFLNSEPDFRNYELLKSIGVTFLESKNENGKCMVKFRNKLPSHIHAGILAHFKRTDNCNQFFFNHCNINEQIEVGLIKTTLNKINYSREVVFKRVCEFALNIPDKIETLTCVPPAPAKEFPYGDIVPYGFLLAAISPKFNEDFHQLLPLRENVIKYLNEVSKEGLWSYDRTGIVTATDSALVLLGYYKPASIAALEKFSDGNGGYYPQMFSDTGDKSKMKVDESNLHWCKTDVGTTYLVSALRSTAELPEITGDDFYEKTFENRSGLFFANPYMTDYFLAMALSYRDNPTCNILKEKLKNEIINSMNEDYSFGNFDVSLSTAFAILALSELGFNDRVLSLCQLKLSEMINVNIGVMTPFYSTLKIDKKKFTPAKITSLILADGGKQAIDYGGEYYVVSHYEDRAGILTDSVILMALSVKTNPEINDTESSRRTAKNSNELYACNSLKDYVKLVLRKSKSLY